MEYYAPEDVAPEEVSPEEEVVVLPTKSRRWGAVLITISLVLLLSVGATVIAATVELAQKQKGPAGPPASNSSDYWDTVYPGRPVGGKIDVNAKRFPVLFLWDTVASGMLPPQARNLSLTWPPPAGQSYRLVAFPFPDTKSKNNYINALVAVFELVNTYNDSHGFPGFFVSVYNAWAWPVLNPFMPAVPDAKTRTTAPVWQADSVAWQVRSGALQDQSCRFPLAANQWLEVMHACYPVPGFGYPFCDDLGFWLYLARGSGVWWNTGRASVGLHKIERGTHLTARMLLWKCYAEFMALSPPGVTFADVFDAPANFDWQWATPPSPKPQDWAVWQLVADQLWKITFPDSPGVDAVPAWAPIVAALKQGKPPGAKLQFRALWDQAVAKAVDRGLKAKGRKSIFWTIFQAVRKETGGKDIAPDALLFFRMFETRQSVRLQYYLLTGGLGLFAASVGLCLLTLFLAPFGAGSWWLPLVFLLLAGAVGMWWVLGGLDEILKALGWATLDGAMEQFGLKADAPTVSKVWNAYCSPFFVLDGGKQVSTLDFEGGTYAPDSPLMRAFGGFANNWIFDSGLTLFASFLQYDSVIMHTQPNKSGTWQVEMLDVTRVRLAKGTGCDTESGSAACIFKGGVCGMQTCQNFTAQGCRSPGNPKFFACDNTFFPPGAKPPWTRGGLCLGYRVSSDPNLYESTQPEKSLSPCRCLEGSSTKCLSCSGHVSGRLCAGETTFPPKS